MGNKESRRMGQRKKELEEFMKKETEAQVYLGPCEEDNHKKKVYPCMLCMNTKICDNCAFKGASKERSHCALCKVTLDQNYFMEGDEDDDG